MGFTFIICFILIMLDLIFNMFKLSFEAFCSFFRNLYFLILPLSSSTFSWALIPVSRFVCFPFLSFHFFALGIQLLIPTELQKSLSICVSERFTPNGSQLVDFERGIGH